MGGPSTGAGGHPSNVEGGRVRVSEKDQAVADAESDRFGSARSAELAEDGCDVEFDSMLRNCQSCRNLFVPQSACEHLQHFVFATCQRFKELGQWARRWGPGKSRVYLTAMHDD